MKRLFRLLPVLLTFCAAPALGAHSVAVMPFENVNKDASLDWISMGTAETITTKLLNIEGLVLIERALLLKVMEEQKLQLTGAIDQKTAVQMGKLLGARILVLGAYQKAGPNLRITARFVDVESAGVLQTAIETGKLDDIFDLQDKIVTGLARNLNIELKEKEIAKIREKPTQSLEAYEHFGQGALLVAKKDLPGAVKELQKAKSIDPEFSAADTKLKEAFWSLNPGNFWRYRMSIGPKDSTPTFTSESIRRAAGMEDFEGVPAFSYVKESGKPSIAGAPTLDAEIGTRSVEFFAKAEDGIHMLGNRIQTTTVSPSLKMTIVMTTRMDPPMLNFPYDYQVGKEWRTDLRSKTVTRTESESAGYSTHTVTGVGNGLSAHFKIIGIETLQVPAGTFECFVSEMNGEGFETGPAGERKGPATPVRGQSWFAPGVGIVKTRVVLQGDPSRPGMVIEETLQEYHLEP